MFKLSTPAESYHDDPDAYYRDCIEHFNGLGGNIPYRPTEPYLSNMYTFHSRIGKYPKNERYYLHPLKFGCYYGSNLYYKYTFDSLRMIGYSTNTEILVPIDYLISKGFIKLRDCLNNNFKGIVFKSSIHQKLNTFYSTSRPYISIREILNKAVEIIGEHHVYFKEHHGIKSCNYRHSSNASDCPCPILFPLCLHPSIWECDFAQVK